jgi:hypothetical protein
VALSAVRRGDDSRSHPQRPPARASVLHLRHLMTPHSRHQCLHPTDVRLHATVLVSRFVGVTPILVFVRAVNPRRYGPACVDPRCQHSQLGLRRRPGSQIAAP